MAFRYEARAEVWASAPGQAGGWHFVTLPREISDGLRALRGAGAQGWGSMRVQATLGATTWRTSVFPDRRRNAFLLPVKAEVRAREGVRAGDTVVIAVEVTI